MYMGLKSFLELRSMLFSGTTTPHPSTDASRQEVNAFSVVGQEFKLTHNTVCYVLANGGYFLFVF